MERIKLSLTTILLALQPHIFPASERGWQGGWGGGGLAPKAAALPGAQSAHQGPWAWSETLQAGAESAALRRKSRLRFGKRKDLQESKAAFLPI